MVKRMIAAGMGLALVGVVVAALAGAALVGTAQAQGPRGGGGRWATEGGTVVPGSEAGQGQGQGQGQGRNREVASPEVTVSGVVTAAQFELGEEPELSIQKSDGTMVQVELGPEWHIEQQQFTANVGDRLTITGHHDPDGTTLIVHTVQNETTGQTTFFRDSTGRPAWAGRGRRS
jgi:hypothetical protein